MTKIDASTVIGANELIEGLKRPFDEIDKNIGDLESEILKLQKEVANVENPFSIQSLGKVKETKEKINLYETSKAAADAEREKMLKAGYDQTYTQANKIISDHQARLFQEFKPKSEEIKQKIKEIRDIYAEVKQATHESRRALSSFVYEVEPFLNPNAEGMSREPITELVYNANSDNVYTSIVGDQALGVKGLKPNFFN